MSNASLGQQSSISSARTRERKTALVHDRLFINSRYSPDCSLESYSENTGSPIVYASLDLCERTALAETRPPMGLKWSSLPLPDRTTSRLSLLAQKVQTQIQIQIASTGIRWPWRFSTRRVIILAAIVMGMRIFVGEASVVPTASMEARFWWADIF